jgi:hypothetical protein
MYMYIPARVKFPKGGGDRSIKRHALDLTNISAWYHFGELGRLIMYKYISIYIYICNIQTLKGGGEIPPWLYVEKTLPAITNFFLLPFSALLSLEDVSPSWNELWFPSQPQQGQQNKYHQNEYLGIPA